ncbi:MAG TPA: NfeD family protein [Xanthobacteraceae bacterium]|nr:NfeD family protein [Xanthobacteraceae bacterium]
MDSALWSWAVAMGGWLWFVLAAIFLLIELTLPGVFMLWLGLAAIMIGVISLTMVLSWQAQLIAFAVLSIACIPAWRYFARKVEGPVERPFLNRRADSYVGRVFTLEKPIVDGVGTIRIEDTVWRVSGPSLPAGSRVKVSRADGAELAVEAA